MDAILLSMKAQHLYNDHTRRWIGFPDPSVPKTKNKEKKTQERSLLHFYHDCGSNSQSRRKFRRPLSIEDGQGEMGGPPL